MCESKHILCLKKHIEKKERGIERGKSVTLGQRIRKIRREKDISQKELALKAGLERSDLSRIEHDKKDSKIGTLKKIALALETTASELLRES